MNKFNIENYLNSLPEDTTIINLFRKKINYLPDLSKFKKLEVLICSYNKLTFLPKLNKKLKTLDCSNNKLTFLPKLNENLLNLDCSRNKLTSLPKLNKKLQNLECCFTPFNISNTDFLGIKNN